MTDIDPALMKELRKAAADEFRVDIKSEELNALLDIATLTATLPAVIEAAEARGAARALVASANDVFDTAMDADVAHWLRARAADCRRADR